MRHPSTRYGRRKAAIENLPHPFVIAIPEEDRFRAAFKEDMSIVSRQLVRLAVARAMLAPAKHTQGEAVQIVADQLCLSVEAVLQAIELVEEPAQ